MAKELLSLDNGTTCSSWNYSDTRLATGSVDGTLSIFDLRDPTSSSSSLRSSFKTKVHEGNIVKIVWLPPEYGDAVACISADGIVSLLEEIVEDSQPLQWKLCKTFGSSASKVLDVQFGISLSHLKMVAAYSDGHVRVFELLDPLELSNWQLQAEFQNVIESVSSFGKALSLSASISLNPQKGGSQESSFLVGFNSNTPELNSSKVWEFDQAHQRWLPVAELALSEDKGDQVYAVAWAPNIGRPYEIIAVATHKGLSIWHLGLNPDHNGRLSVDRVALLSGHEGAVWQMEWDMSGMTLATTGDDGMVRLWQSNLNGVWHQQAAFEPTS
ncbi:epoxide hydrolase, soluble (sEH) [Trifolium repens]|nr:epoxide hydrolase, soluble (sEH) [Trifolium repens]